MEPALIDTHSQGITPGELGLGTFETHLASAEGARAPAPQGVTFFDGPLGRAVRRWCPPLLGLPAHCPPAQYLARRRELGAYRASRTLLRGAGIEVYLVDGEPADPAARSHEIVRLETLAARVAKTTGTVAGFLRDAAEAVHSAAQSAVAFACGARAAEGSAHRSPGLVEVRRSAARLLQGGAPDTVLVRHLLWSALASGLPVQLHGGHPDDVAAFLDHTAGQGGDLVLIPAAPHHRAAARLAAVHPHVYADAGPDPAATLSLAPAGKLLFSSGAAVLPELYVVAARAFAAALDRLQTGWPAEGLCSRGDAQRMCAAVAGGTARRVYHV
ncbi:amidohydrolase [Streptomyces sp. NPDC051940]|uniref:amidohydrolase n=1 Tax=Streptomyces sp. NPDC051940 TaxID=3155675 RepID=UPI0034286FDB